MQYLFKECPHGELGFVSPSTPAYLKGNTEIVFSFTGNKTRYIPVGTVIVCYLAAWRVRAV